LSELFSNLDLPSAQLPHLYAKEEVSYRAVQKKVLDRIDAEEPILPEKKLPKKQILLGLAAATLFVGGGVGTFAASRVGMEDKKTDTSATISSNEDVLHSYAALEYKPEEDVDDTEEEIDLSTFTPASNYSCPNDMHEIKLDEVLVRNTEDSVEVLLHLKPLIPDSFTEDLTAMNIQCSMTLGGYCGYWKPCESISDANNLYYLFYAGAQENILSNRMTIDIEGMVHGEGNGVVRWYSLLEIERDLGYSLSEINAGVTLTEQEQAYVEEQYQLYAPSGEYYLKKSDIYAEGKMELQIDLDLASVNSDLPCPPDLNTYQTVEDASIDNGLDNLDVTWVGMKKDSQTLSFVMQFRPTDDSYVVSSGDDIDLFRQILVDCQVANDDTQSAAYAQNGRATCQFYADPENQCLYFAYQVKMVDSYQQTTATFAFYDFLRDVPWNAEEGTQDDVAIVRIPVGETGTALAGDTTADIGDRTDLT
jgi:hypothetical protein